MRGWQRLPRPKAADQAMKERLTRGGFVARGAVVVGGVAVPGLARVGRAAAAPGTRTVYGLDPDGNCAGNDDGFCKACANHAANSVFPTAKAADGNRAHIGCNCCVVEGKLEHGKYVALFGNPRHELRSYRADLRSNRVKGILKGQLPNFG
jgi:hypothetical protein